MFLVVNNVVENLGVLRRQQIVFQACIHDCQYMTTFRRAGDLLEVAQTLLGSRGHARLQPSQLSYKKHKQKANLMESFAA